jgi:hypothetical protein
MTATVTIGERQEPAIEKVILALLSTVLQASIISTGTFPPICAVEDDEDVDVDDEDEEKTTLPTSFSRTKMTSTTHINTRTRTNSSTDTCGSSDTGLTLSNFPMSVEEMKFTCPSLSLHHNHNHCQTRSQSNECDTGGGSSGGSSSSRNDNGGVLSSDNDKETKMKNQQRPRSRKQAAEEHAIELLARPLSVSLDSSCLSIDYDCDKNTTSEYAGEDVCLSASTSTCTFTSANANVIKCLQQVPATLLQNIVSSFAVLVDSRLHAYAEFLARHAIAVTSRNVLEDVKDSVKSIHHKMETIRQVGNQITADAMALRFQMLNDSDKNNNDKSADTSVSSVAAATSELNLLVAIDFRIVVGKGIVKTFSIAFSTPGQITGTFFITT